MLTLMLRRLCVGCNVDEGGRVRWVDSGRTRSRGVKKRSSPTGSSSSLCSTIASCFEGELRLEGLVDVDMDEDVRARDFAA